MVISADKNVRYEEVINVMNVTAAAADQESRAVDTNKIGMSAATLHESGWHESGCRIRRRKPFQLPAGILALAVHGAFFALLYLGFAWQTRPPEMTECGTVAEPAGDS